MADSGALQPFTSAQVNQLWREHLPLINKESLQRCRVCEHSCSDCWTNIITPKRWSGRGETKCLSTWFERNRWRGAVCEMLPYKAFMVSFPPKRLYLFTVWLSSYFFVLSTSCHGLPQWKDFHYCHRFRSVGASVWSLFDTKTPKIKLTLIIIMGKNIFS